MMFFHSALVYIISITFGITMQSRMFTTACDIEVKNSLYHPENNGIYRKMSSSYNSRPRYQHVGSDSYICYLISMGMHMHITGMWSVSLTPCDKANLVIRVREDAETPDQVTSTWEEYDGHWISSSLTVRCHVSQNTSSTVIPTPSTTPRSTSTLVTPSTTPTPSTTKATTQSTTQTPSTITQSTTQTPSTTTQSTTQTPSTTKTSTESTTPTPSTTKTSTESTTPTRSTTKTSTQSTTQTPSTTTQSTTQTRSTTTQSTTQTPSTTKTSTESTTPTPSTTKTSTESTTPTPSTTKTSTESTTPTRSTTKTSTESTTPTPSTTKTSTESTTPTPSTTTTTHPTTPTPSTTTTTTESTTPTPSTAQPPTTVMRETTSLNRRPPMTSATNSPIIRADRWVVTSAVGFAVIAAIFLILVVILGVMYCRKIKPLASHLPGPSVTRPRAILDAHGGIELDVKDQNLEDMRKQRTDDPPRYTDLFP